MPGRWPAPIPKLSVGWGPQTARAIESWMRRMVEAMSNLQIFPGTPTTIQAGVAADAGDGPAPALDDHVHKIETGSPIGLSNTNAEGSGTALMRAAALIKRDVRVAAAGVDVGTRNRLNLTANFVVGDDPGNDEVDIDVNLAAIEGQLGGWARHFLMLGGGE